MAKARKAKRKSNPTVYPGEARTIEARRSLQRALRAERQVRSLAGQLRRSMQASSNALFELHKTLSTSLSIDVVEGREPAAANV